MLGMPCIIDSIALRVSGFDGAILWGEDKILDVLDLTENYTFWLVSSVASDDQSPSSPSPEMVIERRRAKTPKLLMCIFVGGTRNLRRYFSG